MRRDTAVKLLKEQKEALHSKFGVTRLGLFGSVARDEATDESDVDVVMEMEHPNLFVAVNIKETLEEAFRVRVDLVRYRERMNPFLKRRIDKEAIYV
ncbi:MAG: nucleotidyltransferase [Gammaproteobacteria bacterium]|nr:nucleotidyltransferase [Gammaproteobacteria bacterium]